MKKEFSVCPDGLKEKEMYGFDWLEHVTAIPSPIALVTSYKSNGKTNATLQSWFTFTNDKGFYCVFASVNKKKHMYLTIKERKELVINFPSVDSYRSCYLTIQNNHDEDDELLLAGLTVTKGSTVDAPIVNECFLNLECEYAWEHEVSPASNTVVMCVKVKNILMDEKYYQDNGIGRYGSTGYLYNIHSPLNPETLDEEETYVATINKNKTHNELFNSKKGI